MLFPHVIVLFFLSEKTFSAEEEADPRQIEQHVIGIATALVTTNFIRAVVRLGVVIVVYSKIYVHFRFLFFNLR